MTQNSEIIDLILADRKLNFDNELTEAIINQTDGYVFKDIEKLIDKIMFDHWKNLDVSDMHKNCESIDLKRMQNILYDYTCINMSETKLYKAKSQLNWNLDVVI